MNDSLLIHQEATEPEPEPRDEPKTRDWEGPPLSKPVQRTDRQAER